MYRINRSGAAVIAVAMTLVAGSSSSYAGSDSDNPSDTTASTSEGGSDSAAPAELESLQVSAYPGLPLSLPQWVALEAGIFENHGLDAEIVPISGGPNHVAALESDSIDVLTFTLPAVMRVNEEGTDLQAVVNSVAAPIYDVFGTTEAVEECAEANAEVPTDRIVCLQDGAVGVAAIGGDAYATLVNFLDDAGLSVDDIDLVAVGASSNLLGAFEAGQISWAIGVEPAITQLIEDSGIATMLFTGAEAGTLDPWLGQTYFAKRSRLADEPDYFGKFRDSIVDAIAFMKDPANKDLVINVMVRDLGLTESVAESLYATRLDAFDPNLPCDAVDNVRDWAADQGQITDLARAGCESIVWEGAPR